MSALPLADDALHVRRATNARGLLRTFNDVGVLAAADVHVAARLGAIAGEEDDAVLLAVAFAVRAPRLGHVCVDLTAIASTATVDVDLEDEDVDLSVLPWPAPGAWVDSVRESALVAVTAEQAAPLRLAGSTLYLDRYWCEEAEVAADLQTLSAEDPADVDDAVLTEGLSRLFGEQLGERQALASASAVLSRLAVVAGGPGTGKTTTVARILALLFEQAEAQGRPEPKVALAAPTAKAAARLLEAVRDETARLEGISDGVRASLLRLESSTLHRLLGRRPGSHSRFRHDRSNRLAHDVVVVDETSMVSLTLMSRLVEAVRPATRLILVGDPGQLASVEAGAVLGDVVGPCRDELLIAPSVRARLERVTGRPVDAGDPPAGAAIGHGIVVLDRVWRHGDEIADVAEAIRRGEGDAVVAALRASPERITWIEEDADETTALGPVRTGAVVTAEAVTAAARGGDARTALAELGRFRLLCAHRRGPYGVSSWTSRIESWLAEQGEHVGPVAGPWYVGRPLLMTRNDYGLRLFNGDTGVVIATPDGRVSAAFERRGEIATFRPARLDAIETVHAMTVHKSQGSQYDTAAVILPPPRAQILTRELLYTAVTRAKEHLILAGTEASVRAAVDRPVARASGLRWRLWNEA